MKTGVFRCQFFVCLHLFFIREVRMQKKIVIGFFLVLTIVSLVCSAGCIDSRPTYVISIHSALSPWEFADENGEPAGVSVDLLKMVSGIVDANFEFVFMESGWEEALLNGDVDGQGSMVKTPEREAQFAFTTSPFPGTQYGAISYDGSGVTLDDVLAGRASIAVKKDSAYDEWAEAYFGDKYDGMVANGTIILESSVDFCAMSVLSHNADSTVAGDISLSEMLKNYQSLNFLGYIGEPVDAGLVVRKGDTELLNLVNEGFSKVAGTPEFEALVQKYNLQYKKDVYRVGIDAMNNPWSYVGEDGNYTGYDIEQIEWIADYNGFDVVYEVYDWDNNINAIVNNKLDMWASSMTITPKRSMHVAFSTPYYTSGVGVLTRSDSVMTQSDFRSPDAKIVTTYGTTYVDWLRDELSSKWVDRKIADGSLILAENYDECCRLLESHTVNFFVTGTKQMEAEVSKGHAKILFVEDDIEKFGIATGNGNIALLDMINKGLDAFEKSGKKAELHAKYQL